MNCPHCAHALTAKQLGVIGVDECRACGGVWFDAGELEAFRMSVEGKQEPEEILSRFAPAVGMARSFCPRCEHDCIETGSVGARVAGVCLRCSGIFVSGEELRQFSKSRGRRVAEASAEGAAEVASWAPDLILELVGGLFSGL